MNNNTDGIIGTYQRLLNESNKEVVQLRNELRKEKRLPVKMNIPAFISLSFLATWKVFDTIYYIVTLG